MNLISAGNQLGRRAVSLALIGLLSAGAGGLLAVSKTEYRVSLSSVVDIWADFIRDVDSVGLMITRIGPAREMEIGRGIEHRMNRSFDLQDGTELHSYVAGVGKALVPGVQRDAIGYRFHVVRSPVINAYAIPGGGVYITTGMLGFLDSEAELAAVLGHEISHVDLKHCIGKLQYELAVRRVLGRNLAAVVAVGYNLIGLGFSEQRELESDSNGMLLAAKAGYEPGAAITVFKRFADKGKKKRGSGDIDVGHVEGAFVARVRGSGNVSAANVGTATIEKHGSGNVRLGRVAGGLSYISFGIGDADIGAVNGPVVVETSSSGEVYIHEGRADPLKVVMREYGDFTMDGEAVNPDLTAEGASIVRLSSYLGKLVARGTGYFEVKRR